MRFDETKEYKVSDLLLDEANYRFKAAKDQRECVRKIYEASPQSFKGMLKSIAEDDLGEPLLVFSDKKKNIVLDGNRRLAALKVLSSDDFLPDESLKNYVDKMREVNIADFSKINAQVSSDRKLIMKTVLERHAGAKTGTMRILWNAYASALFGYTEEIGNNNEWHFIALLARTEEMHPNAADYIGSKKFSYETFRRLMREAFKRKLISQEIFSDRSKRIKTTADKKLIKDAVTKTLKILDAMEKREISLSRDENFADKEAVAKFFDDFTLSPDAQRVEDAKNAANQNDDTKESGNTQKSDSSQSEDDAEDNSAGYRKDSGANPAGQNDDGEEEGTGNGRQSNNGITKSEEIEKKLKKLKSTKLTGLYKSLCTVSLIAHPQLMYVGAWSFFEVLSKLTGNTNPKTTSTPDFPSFFRQKMKAWNFDAADVSDWGNTLDIISKYGNATKHSQNTTPVSASQLRHDFEVLEPLILIAIQEATTLKTKKAA